jgi:hypothetical protein
MIKPWKEENLKTQFTTGQARLIVILKKGKQTTQRKKEL